jgi:hypothetical protein
MGANAQTSVPAFTAGQVLTAAQMTQVNTGVPVFASSTERDAAFGGTGEKTLAEGQMAYLEDTNETQYYDGSSWLIVGASGLVLISRTTIGSAVSSVTVSGAFSTDYDNYRIIVEGGAASSALTSLQLTLGATATGYYWAFIYGLWGGASPALARGSNSSSWALYGADTNGYSAALDILGPYLTDETSFHGSSTQISTSGSARTGHVAGFLNNTTSYTDFTLTISSGTITGGTIDVYGYAKA